MKSERLTVCSHSLAHTFLLHTLNANITAFPIESDDDDDDDNNEWQNDNSTREQKKEHIA